MQGLLQAVMDGKVGNWMREGKGGSSQANGGDEKSTEERGSGQLASLVTHEWGERQRAPAGSTNATRHTAERHAAVRYGTTQRHGTAEQRMALTEAVQVAMR